MNNIFFRVGAFFIILIGLQCSAYELNFIPTHITSPVCTADLSGVARSESEEIHIEMMLENTSAAEVTIDPVSVELVTPQGWRSSMINVDADNTIAVKTKKHFSFAFQPINSMALHKLMKIPGDFAPHYTLVVPLLSAQDPIRFSLHFADKAYQNYLEQAGQERTLQLHLPSMNANEFVATQMAYLKKHFKEEYPEPSSIVAIPQQIVINGLAFQWRAYNLQGKLAISLQLINQHSHDVVIDAARFSVELEGKKYFPTNNFSSLPSYVQPDVVENTHFLQYRVKPGKRFSWIFSYDASLTTKAPVLNVEGVRVADKPLFARKLGFSPAQNLEN